VRVAAFLLVLLAALAIDLAAAAAQTSLTVTGRARSTSFTREQLLAHPSLRTVAVAHDPVFGRAMTYRAVPVAGLLREVGTGADDYVQARAVDDFSVAIPADLLLDAGEAFLAIEEPGRPWPLLQKAGKDYDAGPFYLVWAGRRGADVSSEYWAYRLAALTAVDSPARRWPQLGVGADLPADDFVRRGLDRFVAVCLACHRFKGAGEASQGPDLGTPMNPVDYFRPNALRRLLRTPDQVRTWPERKMPAFTAEMLSDADLDAILAWLAYKARQAR